ncbi:unnamed protein product [marine sediment metagenome]|uniref:Uncharacterized protein n=1 Tax=marine sediment metagenome TaxID=412755 RepID=X1P2P8_9ZZZZ
MAGVLDKLEERIMKRMDERMGPMKVEMQKMNKTLIEIRDILKENPR